MIEFSEISNTFDSHLMATMRFHRGDILIKCKGVLGNSENNLTFKLKGCARAVKDSIEYDSTWLRENINGKQVVHITLRPSSYGGGYVQVWVCVKTPLSRYSRRTYSDPNYSELKNIIEFQSYAIHSWLKANYLMAYYLDYGTKSYIRKYARKYPDKTDYNSIVAYAKSLYKDGIGKCRYLLSSDEIRKLLYFFPVLAIMPEIKEA